MTEIAERLKEVLTDKPQSRQRLCYMLGTNDRALRSAKAELVKAGVNVCSNSRTRGYYIGSDEERRHAAAELRKKAYEMLAEANALDPAEVEGQIVWSV